MRPRVDEHAGPLGVPACQGAMIGRQERQFTAPVGVEVDAGAGTVTMLEPAVV